MLSAQLGVRNGIKKKELISFPTITFQGSLDAFINDKDWKRWYLPWASLPILLLPPTTLRDSPHMCPSIPSPCLEMSSPMLFTPTYHVWPHQFQNPIKVSLATQSSEFSPLWAAVDFKWIMCSGAIGCLWGPTLNGACEDRSQYLTSDWVTFINWQVSYALRA